MNYTITVKNKEQVVWDSDIVASHDSQRIIYEGRKLKSRETLIWQVEVTTKDEIGMLDMASSEWATFEMGLLSHEDWVGKWVEPEESVDIQTRKPVPYLRKPFTVKEGLVAARIYQTAHGLYDFWLNGKEGTKDRFNPGLTSYYYRLQYQTYDITSLLQEGINVWSIRLADGWWRGSTGGTVTNNFGYKLHYIGQIELHYKDGTHEIIGSDEAFRTSTGGLLASDMMMGDNYDANSEPADWKMAHFDDSDWQTVSLLDERRKSTCGINCCPQCSNARKGSVSSDSVS